MIHHSEAHQIIPVAHQTTHHHLLVLDHTLAVQHQVVSVQVVHLLAQAHIHQLQAVSVHLVNHQDLDHIPAAQHHLDSHRKDQITMHHQDHHHHLDLDLHQAQLASHNILGLDHHRLSSLINK